MKTLHSVTSIAVLWLCVTAAPAIQAADKPDAQFLATALARQESAGAASLQVQWTMASLDPPKEGQLRCDVKYIRTRNVLFKEERQGRLTASNDVKPQWIVRRRYDRVSGAYKECVRDHAGKLPPRATVLTNPEISSRFTSTSLVDPVLFPLSIGPLVKAIGKGLVGDTQEEIDGYMCWRVEIPERLVGTETRGRWTIWVDPSIGFCPRRLDAYYIRGDVTRETVWSFTDYKPLAEHVYFPMEMTGEYDETGTRGWRYTVTKAECGKEIPAADIAVDIPSGSKVYVMPEGTWHTEP